MKKLFSDRVGVTKPNNVIQLNFMTEELRNLLWNSFKIFYVADPNNTSPRKSLESSNLYKLGLSLWMSYFRYRIEDLPYYFNDFVLVLHNYFFKVDWYKVYNFLDFCLDYTTESYVDKNAYIQTTNEFLKQELSGYRIIGDCFAPITNDEQINNINETLRLTNLKKLNGVYDHISASLQLLSNKEIKSVDKYRNTIKEAISAVESLCNQLNKKKSDGLKGALKLLKPKIKLHSALEEGFIKLYGYTSDTNGIRHPIMDEPNLDLEDAIYMVVTCSSFVNYLILKAEKAGLIK